MTSNYLFFEGTPSPLAAVRPRPAGLVSAPAREDDGDSPEVGSFFAALLAPVGLPATAYHMRALRRRLAACLRFLRADSPAEGARRLRERPELAPAAVNVLLLGVSEFFRDPPVFDRLAADVLPALRRRFGRLRIWSAGCAGGQELYSIAMLAAEAGWLGDCTLVGSDCRPEAIAGAAAGVYPIEMVAPLSDGRRERFFARRGQSAAVGTELRDAVEWRRASFFAGAEPGPWHLILWRNVAIYLEAAAREQVWSRLWDQLAPGGFVVTGKADLVPPELPLSRTAACIHQKPLSGPDA